MKYLEIKNSKGYYWNGENTVEIDKINKDDLLKLINHAEEDNFEMDEYDEDKLQHKAHQIIYQSIYNKLSEFLEDKEQFNRKVNNLYAKAIGEYNANVEAETDEEDIQEIDEEEIDPEDIPF